MTEFMRKTGIATAILGGMIFGVSPGMGDTTTRPDGATAPSASVSSAGMRPGPAYVIQRFKRGAGQLDLSADEKSKVDAVFETVNQQGLDLSKTLGDLEPQDRFQKLAAFSRQIRGELAGVLTDDEMKKLDQTGGTLRGGSQSGGLASNGSAPGGVSATKSPTADAGSGDAQAGQRVNRQGKGTGTLVDNMQQALAKLDLSSDQQQQIKDVLASTREKLVAIRKTAAAGGDVQQDLQQVRQDVRDKLKTILTPEQMQTFAQTMQQLAQQRGGANGQRGRQFGSANSEKPVVTENKPEDLQTSGPEVGSAVPDVKFTQVNGRMFSPSQYKGHVLVLEFGSMSSPVFRAHVQDMEKLKSSEGQRAFFMIVYTREAFPAGDKNAERNKDEGISVPEAKTLDERKTQALEAQRELRITIPIAVDSMDDAVSSAFGGFPNGAVVIGKDGTIAARQQWTNPDTLRGMIDDACQAAPTPTATASANH